MKANLTVPKRHTPYPTHRPSGQNTALQRAAAGSASSQHLATLQMMADTSAPTQRLQQIAPAPQNRTGLPDTLKSGIEGLSGMSMGHVRVHRNSAKPAQLQAHAYAQGSDIHLGPGQEQHLPHEAWHVVQQAQGRVKPTTQLKGIGVNDDAGLEAEADVMGAKAAQFKTTDATRQGVTATPKLGTIQRKKKKLEKSKLNVVGEDHNESGGQRPREQKYIRAKGIDYEYYWTELTFAYVGGGETRYGDPLLERASGMFSRIREAIEPIYNINVSNPNGLNEQQSTEVLRLKNDQMPVLWDYMNRARDDLKRVRDDPRWITQGDILEEMIADLTSFIKIYMEYEVETLNDVKDIYTVTKYFRDLYLPIEKKFVTFYGTAIESWKDNIVNRSRSMHHAANLNATRSGVWKIGDQHVADIKTHNELNSAVTYNLVTRAEFQMLLDNYDKWLANEFRDCWEGFFGRTEPGRGPIEEDASSQNSGSNEDMDAQFALLDNMDLGAPIPRGQFDPFTANEDDRSSDMSVQDNPDKANKVYKSLLKSYDDE